MPRIKTPVSEPLDRNQVESLVNDIALCMNNRRKLVSEADAAKLAIDNAIAGNLAQIDDAVKNETARVQEWAEANPAEFVKRKSIDFPCGTIGFRTGTPKLKTLRKASWDAIVEVFAVGKRFAAYLRTKQEVDKEKILADHAKGVLTDADLNNVALKVVQEESFFVEPNLTQPDLRATAPVAS